MLRQLFRPFVFWCCSEDGEDDGNTSAYGFGAIKNSGGTKPELLRAGCVLPAYDCGAVEQDLDAFASGKDCGDPVGGMSDIDLGLGCETRGDGV